MTEDQKQEILQRGVDAQAFIRSPLFLEVSKWVEQEERLLGVAIALDRRDKAQERLTREQFVEQMAGYYRGIKTAVSLFQGYISKANELQKQIDQEEEVNKEKKAQEAEMENLRSKVYGQNNRS